jgi:hypothetical protein
MNVAPDADTGGMTMKVNAGDVIETEINGEVVTALVLLANDEHAILDLCDGSTPFVVGHDELDSVRVFSPLAPAA